jgi:tetratricopeptide (TPR) repeat protein
MFAVLEVTKAAVVVRAPMALLAGVAAVVIPELRERRKQDDERARVLGAHLRRLSEQPGLTRITNVDGPALLGPGRSVSATAEGDGRLPAYVGRTLDPDLDNALDVYPFVLVVGDSKAGKSRSAYEAMRRVFPDRVLFVPAKTDSLVAVVDLGLALPDAVVWLDDIERYVTTGGLTEHVLGYLADSRTGAVTVLATIRATEMDRLSPIGDVNSPAWRLLERAELVRLPRKLDGDERRRAEARFDSESITAALERYGLAEYLAAGPDLVNRFENNRTTKPVGTAIVRAAVDWRRVGITRPIPLEPLRSLYPYYLEPEGRTQENLGTDAFGAGLDWAKEIIYATSALLVSSGDGVLASDYLLDHVEQRRSDPIPDGTWQLALKSIDLTETFNVGFAAWKRSMPEIAVGALRVAAGAGIADPGPLAEYTLGMLLEEQGDPEAARDAYQRAIDSGHAEHSPRAAFNLAALHERAGHPERAQALYQLAAASGHPEYAPRGAVILAERLEQARNTTEAQRLYEMAADSGHRELAPRAANNLGRMLENKGELQMAARRYRQAIESQHRTYAPIATFNLANVLRRLEDVASAQATYERAVAYGHGHVSPMAANNLGALLEDRGDLVGAKAAYQKAMPYKNEEAAISATYRLGLLLAKDGDKAAGEMFRTVVQSRHPRYAGRAAFNLAILLQTAGDIEEARTAYQRAAAAGDKEASHLASALLNRLPLR